MKVISLVGALMSLPLLPPGILSQTDSSLSVRCIKDKDVGDRFDFNIYYCTEDTKPECCEVDSKFTCCETQISNTVKEQATLWGSLGGVIGVVAILCLCYHKDGRWCTDGTWRPLYPSCKCCRRSETHKAVLAGDGSGSDDISLTGIYNLRDGGIDLHQEVDSGRGSACSVRSSPVASREPSNLRPTTSGSEQAGWRPLPPSASSTRSGTLVSTTA